MKRQGQRQKRLNLGRDWQLAHSALSLSPRSPSASCAVALSQTRVESLCASRSCPDPAPAPRHLSCLVHLTPRYSSCSSQNSCSISIVLASATRCDGQADGESGDQIRPRLPLPRLCVLCIVRIRHSRIAAEAHGRTLRSRCLHSAITRFGVCRSVERTVTARGQPQRNSGAATQRHGHAATGTLSWVRYCVQCNHVQKGSQAALQSPPR